MKGSIVQSAWPFIGIALVSYAGHKVPYEIVFLGRDAALTIVTRTLSSICIALMTAAYWSNMNAAVLRRVIRRPRYAHAAQHQGCSCRTDQHTNSLCSVIYLSASTVLREVLATVMSWGVRELVSGTMLPLSAAATFLLVPLSDSLDPGFAGPRTVRMLASLGAATKLYLMAWCKGSPKRCRTLYHDYTFTSKGLTHRSMVNATFNSTCNSTAVGTEHVIFSTLDLMGSCEVIILVLSLQALMNQTLMQPCDHHGRSGPECQLVYCADSFDQCDFTQDHERDQGAISASLLAVLHPGNAGQANLCANLLGEGTGIALDRWVYRRIRYLVAFAMGSTIFKKRFPKQPGS